MNHQSLIELSDVTIGYGRAPMLRDISLDIRPGDYLALVGPNGAGKSTLVKTLLGTIRPLLGEVIRRRKLRVGYVPQQGNIDPLFPITALEVVRSGGMGGRGVFQQLFGTAPRDAALRALDTIGLEDLHAVRFRELSFGQQQRVLIARALVREPELLVLDEPTAGMDLPSESELLDFVTRLNADKGIAVVLVVHQLALAARRADRVALVNKDGARFAVGDTKEWFTDERLTDLYRYPMEVIDVNGALLIRAATDRRTP